MNESRPEVGSSANNNGGSVITWLVMTYSELVYQEVSLHDNRKFSWDDNKKVNFLFVCLSSPLHTYYLTAQY